MRIIFMGSPEFAARTLDRLMEKGIDVVAVCTMPPRPANRGKKIQPTATALIAEKHNLPIFTPTKLNDEFLSELRAFQPDMFLVVAYGLKLPKNYLNFDICQFGAVNIHASLLPYFRGASPIQATILHDIKQAGITLMQMDEGMDNGAILMQKPYDFSSVFSGDEADTITAPQLHDALQILAEDMVLEYIECLKSGDVITAFPQDETQASYASKITRDDGQIDFSEHDALMIIRKMRAFTPWPGIWFYHQNNAQNEAVRLIVHEAHMIPNATQSNAIANLGGVLSLDDGILVQCKDATLNITKIQKIGGNILSWRDFLNGYPLKVGAKL